MNSGEEWERACLHQDYASVARTSNKEEIMELKREILVRHRHGGFSLIYRVSGDKRAVEFVINSYPSEQHHEFLGQLWSLTPQGVEEHKPTPSYEGQKPCSGCVVTGGDCYADGSSSYGQSLFDDYWRSGNEDLIWFKLEQTYRERFSC